MDIREYIASGILEMYLLGIASAEETREVEANLAAYPELREEMEKIEESIHFYINENYTKQPPVQLKAKVMERLRALAGEDNAITQPKRISLGTFSVPRWSVAASFVFLALSIALNAYLFSKWKTSEQQAARLESEKTQLAEEVINRQARLNQYNEELAMLKQPTLKMVSLTSMKPGVEAHVTVYWDTASKNVFVNVNKLPEVPDSNQYQLWAMVDGVPVDAGMMDMDGTLQKLKTMPRAQAFAITMEKKGGSPVPTMSQLIVMGAVKS